MEDEENQALEFMKEDLQQELALDDISGNSYVSRHYAKRAIQNNRHPGNNPAVASCTVCKVRSNQNQPWKKHSPLQRTHQICLAVSQSHQTTGKRKIRWTGIIRKYSSNPEKPSLKKVNLFLQGRITGCRLTAAAARTMGKIPSDHNRKEKNNHYWDQNKHRCPDRITRIQEAYLSNTRYRTQPTQPHTSE